MHPTSDDVVQLLSERTLSELCLQENSTSRVELLLRPRNVDGASLSPLDFVRQAIDDGRGLDLDLWVGRMASTIHRRLASCVSSRLLAMNVTPIGVSYPQSLVDHVDFPIRFEITEDYWRVDPQGGALQRFSDAVLKRGHTISLDDFSEVSSPAEKWRRLMPNVAEIKLDLGPDTILARWMNAHEEAPLDNECLELLNLIEEALSIGTEVVLERGDRNRAATFVGRLQQMGFKTLAVARQDFDIHKPESLESFIARHSA